nr:MAG TPA: hypothetical protein [Caudoviricetes sp.]
MHAPAYDIFPFSSTIAAAMKKAITANVAIIFIPSFCL